MDCQYGAQYKQPNVPKNSERIYLQGTRKKGCPAHIEIREFYVFPDYNVSSLLSSQSSAKQTRKVREAKLKELKSNLHQKAAIQTTKKYYVSLPTADAHHTCHQTQGIMGLSQKIHPELINKIQELVSAGTTDAMEMKRLLKHHVNHYMCTDHLPDPNDRAYYPNMEDIRNHINKAKKAMQYSVIDQENALRMMEQWAKNSPNSLYRFRPYKDKTLNKEDDNTLQEQLSTEQTLLWVHQEPWQQHLMVKYGNIISLMDATYKTTRYDLPLFFICVRTNTGYCVVAEFIVQSESADCIKEAISVLRQWNPEWCPQFFMADFSEAEIQALESSFPNSFVYLCDFHREQAWERWVHDKKHELSTVEAEILLDHLRACAWAPSNDSDSELPPDGNYQQCVKVMQSTNLWKRNQHVREWIDGTWLKSCKARNIVAYYLSNNSFCTQNSYKSLWHVCTEKFRTWVGGRCKSHTSFMIQLRTTY